MSEVLSAWERLMIARMADRPTALDYIDRIFTSFVELHGDRSFGDDKSIVSGIGLLDNEPVTIIGIQRGRDIKENIERNFGSPNPEGYRKALRHMKLAEKFNRPIICLVDTKGAFCGVGAEERGQGEAIAKNLMEMAGMNVPMISIIIGEGGSGGALALALADRVWMLENSIYSILSPEGFASILWKDSKRSKEAAEVMKITSLDLYKMGVIDKIIKEPVGGAQKDVDFVSISIKENLIKELKLLREKTKEELLEFRYRRFRKYGEFDYI